MRRRRPMFLLVLLTTAILNGTDNILLKPAVQNQDYDLVIPTPEGFGQLVLPAKWMQRLANGETFPAGLTLTPEGRLTGKPTTVADYIFTLEFSDSSGRSQTQTFSMHVGATAPQPLAVAYELSEQIDCRAEKILGTLKEGGTEIFGVATPSTATHKVTVAFQRGGVPAALKSNGQIVGFVTTDENTGRFAATLDSPMYAGEIISVRQYKPAALACKVGTSVDTTQAADPAEHGEISKTQKALENLQNQLASAVVELKNAQQAVEKLRETEKEAKEPAQKAAARTGEESARHDIDQARMKIEDLKDQIARQRGLVDAHVVDVGNNPTMVIAPYDWGRVRAYFTAGILLSKDTGDFSRANLFMDFNLDKNWVNTGRFRFNSYFEARMTAVPETERVAGTTPGQTVDTLIGSRKAASIQGGAYFPIVATRWYCGSSNSLFIAPIARIGFTTTTDRTTTQTTTNTGGAAVVVNTSPVNPDRFYKFHAYGVRLGHYKESGRHNIAAELMSYIDVMVGRFANFDLLQAGTPVKNPDDTPYTGPFHTYRPWRYAVEGLLKVPFTPLHIGLSANVSGSTTPGFNPPKDDLRFFFGTKFDVGKLFSKLGVSLF